MQEPERTNFSKAKKFRKGEKERKGEGIFPAVSAGAENHVCATQFSHNVMIAL
jgi:hypothetical protein